MDRRINKVKLFVNDNDKSRKVAKDLELELKKYNFDLVDNDYDLAISVGGDGSFLGMVKETNFNSNTYYIGVNSGTLGFLQEIDIKDTKDFVKRLNDNDFRIEDISIQETTVTTENQTYYYNSLNEIVIRSKNFHALKIPVYVDNELLEDFKGDGLLISTSTGSTAYNMSFGGSVVYNTLSTLQITPIAPLNNKVYKSLLVPVIIPTNKTVTLSTYDAYNDLLLIVDGVNKELDNVIKIETKINGKTIKCLRMNDYHFIRIINEKILAK